MATKRPSSGAPLPQGVKPGTRVRPAPLTQRDLDRIEAWNLVRAARHAERVMTDVLRVHGLTPVQFGVLAQLAVDDALTPSALARELGIRPQSAATLVEGMQERDLVSRVGTRGRGRANPVRLTAQGTALLDAAWGPVMDTNDVIGFSSTPLRGATATAPARAPAATP